MTETINEKVERLQTLRDTLEELKRSTLELEQEILEEMQATGATSLLHPDYDVTIPTKREYDPQKVAQLGEVLPKHVFNTVYIPEHEEIVVVPAKVDGKVALKLLRTEYRAELEKCLLPARPRLKITPKKDALKAAAREHANAISKGHAKLGFAGRIRFEQGEEDGNH